MLQTIDFVPTTSCLDDLCFLATCRTLHYIHHKYNKEHSLSPFAGLAFHPLDGILQVLNLVVVAHPTYIGNSNRGRLQSQQICMLSTRPIKRLVLTIRHCHRRRQFPTAGRYSSSRRTS